jgi:soluble lytic murein transglycosylase-like protein
MKLVGNVAVAVGLMMFLAPSVTQGQIYMYRDSNGTVHFSNAPASAGYRPYSSPPKSSHSPVYRYSRSSSARAKAFDSIIREAAARHRVDSALIKAVIRAESDFVPYARSPKGALGLMQLMPATARMHNVSSVFEPRENIEGGVKHLRRLLDQYHGNVRLALAAYNAGDEAVERYGGVPPFQETIDYLDRVLRFRDYYHREQ